MAVNKNVLTSPVTIDVSWEQKSSSKDTLDLTAFLLNESGQISEISDMVFYGTTEVVDMKLTSTKHHITIESKHNKAKNIASQCMTINLDLLPEDIKHIVFVVSNDSEKPLDKFKKAQIAFKDKQNYKDIIQIEDNGDNVFCVSVGDIQKKNELWTLIKESTCYTGGLESAFEDFVPISIRNTYNKGLKDFQRPSIGTGKGLMPSKSQKNEPLIETETTIVSDEMPKTEGNPITKGTRRGVMPVTRRKNKASVSEANASGKANQVVSMPVVEQQVTHEEKPFDQDSSTKNRRGVMPHSKRKKDDGKAVVPEPTVVEQKTHEHREKDSHTQKNVVNMANRFANRKNKRTNNNN